MTRFTTLASIALAAAAVSAAPAPAPYHGYQGKYEAANVDWDNWSSAFSAWFAARPDRTMPNFEQFTYSGTKTRKTRTRTKTTYLSTTTEAAPTTTEPAETSTPTETSAPAETSTPAKANAPAETSSAPEATSTPPPLQEAAFVTEAPTTTAPPTTTAAPTTQTSSGNADIDAYLKGHNDIRAQHGAVALTWADDLAQAAAKWAGNCVWEHSQGKVGAFGENLAAGTGLTAAAAVKMWTDEASEYDPSNPQYSHFTQVVWKATTEVGCAVTSCTGLLPGYSGAVNYHVCEYRKPGNVIGQFAENVQA